VITLRILPLWLACVGVLVGCAGQPPAPSGPAQQVRTAESSAQSAGLQVFTLRDPVVVELSEAALRAEQDGDWDRAGQLLARALQLAPDDPGLLQQRAELHLEQSQWAEALDLAGQSYDIGPKVGELCQRNWRTKVMAHDRLGEASKARQAQQRLDACVVRPPERF
jgi:tetratricopeptide (TPR) repeat protein